MKQFLLVFMLLFVSFASFGQRDSVYLSGKAINGSSVSPAEANISIYPNPVRDNYFTVKSDKEFSSIRITNIIGQEIVMEKYNSPVVTTRITLESARRGMYLIAITFSDNTRCVRRLLVE